MGRLTHLAGRFFTSLRPGGPSSADEAWVRSHLTPPEVELWARMGNPDRRHAVRVARRTEEALGERATPAVMAAALLHDVGKTVSGLRTLGRVLATISRRVAPTGITRRVGLYLVYPELGADLLTAADSDPLTVAWARQHHSPEEEWTVPAELGRALAAADE